MREFLTHEGGDSATWSSPNSRGTPRARYLWCTSSGAACSAHSKAARFTSAADTAPSSVPAITILPTPFIPLAAAAAGEPSGRSTGLPILPCFSAAPSSDAKLGKPSSWRSSIAKPMPLFSFSHRSGDAGYRPEGEDVGLSSAGKCWKHCTCTSARPPGNERTVGWLYKKLLRAGCTDATTRTRPRAAGGSRPAATAPPAMHICASAAPRSAAMTMPGDRPCVQALRGPRAKVLLGMVPIGEGGLGAGVPHVLPVAVLGTPTLGLIPNGGGTM
mmetsp:Transcript_10508/g.28760  ORF Transcript_10508/g.28760 Transcript_10508/m.28760 type:complete len:273 (+) Transcript_10508:2069-2887(+)